MKMKNKNEKTKENDEEKKTKKCSIMIVGREKGKHNKKYREQSSCERLIHHRRLDPRPIARTPRILSIM